jgi:acyl carrier protein
MDTRERIEQIFRDALNIEVPSATTDIIEAGMLDSLALVTLLFDTEQQFGITIPLEDLDIDALRTVDRIALLVDDLVAARDGRPASQGGP